MHMMVDLETLGTSVSAPICQIGAVCFLLPGYSTEVSRLSVYAEPKGILEWDTIKWWLSQEDEARKHLMGGSTVPLKDALLRLSKFVPKDLEGIWSHGASFDIPILSYWYRELGIKIPWDHRMVRDTRTLLWLTPGVKVVNEDKHNALSDALAQARAIQQSYDIVTGSE